MKAGSEKIPGWECLFVHRKQKLFLSVYVDDFRMAGMKSNMHAMWKQLQGSLELEDAVDSVKNAYVGCNQADTKLEDQIVREKNDMFTKLTSPFIDSSVEANRSEAQQSFVDSKKLRDPSTAPQRSDTEL